MTRRPPTTPPSSTLPEVVLALAADGRTGTPVPRQLAHRTPGVLHLAVSLQVVDPSGRWLLQRRATSKTVFPGRWANTCCTHPRPGEEPAHAVVRRAREELGLDVGEVTLAGEFTYRAEDPATGFVEHERDHVFVAVADTTTTIVDPAEIDELARLPFEEALRLVASSEGSPWAGEVLRLARAALPARYQ